MTTLHSYNLQDITPNKQYHLKDNTIYYSELTNNTAQEFLYKHCHNSYELFLFVQGGAEYNIERNIYIMEPYTLLFIKPTEYHYIQLLSSDAYERIVLNFHEDILPKKIASNLSGINSYHKLDENSEIVKHFFQLKCLYDTYDDEDFQIVKISRITEILLSLLYKEKESEYINPRSATPINPIIDEIIIYISNNITQPITLDDISKKLFLSKSYLSHVFKEHMQTQLMNYVKTKKILYAQTLIMKGQKPTSVYEVCGFKNYITFYRTYLSILKKKPSDDLNKNT